MSGFLLDTNILSLLAPGRGMPNARLAAWIEARGDEGTLFISALTLAELERGVRKLKRSGSAARADAIEAWINAIQAQFADRVLPIDGDVARTARMLDEYATSIGRHPGLADILIAATALAHDLILATSNVKHFELLPVKWINPTEP